jgi:hypothetical protein
MKVGTCLLGERARARRIEIGDRKEGQRRMFCGKTRAQRAYPARSYDCDTEFFALQGFPFFNRRE